MNTIDLSIPVAEVVDQHPEVLDLLVELAASHSACFGARLTGAGFGGCTVNLVRKDDLDGFVNFLKAAFLEKSGRDTPIEVCQAVDGAHLVI